MLYPLALASLESLLNRLIKADELHALQGKILQLHCQQPKLGAYICFDDKIHLRPIVEPIFEPKIDDNYPTPHAYLDINTPKDLLTGQYGLTGDTAAIDFITQFIHTHQDRLDKAIALLTTNFGEMTLLLDFFKAFDKDKKFD